MILIYVQFDATGMGKTYKYLLVNPGHYKIDQKKPLLYTRGVTTSGPIVDKMYAIKCEKVTCLPTVVSKQIMLLDEHNHITVQTLGKINITPSTESEPKVSLSKTKKIQTESTVAPPPTTSKVIQKEIDAFKRELAKTVSKVLIRR